jgi:hypothetical protein
VTLHHPIHLCAMSTVTTSLPQVPQPSPSFPSLPKDFLALDEEKWEGLDQLIKSQPVDRENAQLDRLTLSTFDLDKIQDVDLFGVDADSRFSLYIKNLSPPKAGTF